MTLLEHFTIKNFRGFDALELEGLSRVNLFVGKNNSGKTSVLEAVFLLTGASNPMLANNINLLRGLGRGVDVEKLKYLFHNINMENKPDFYAKFSDASERWLTLSAKYQNIFAANNSERAVITTEDTSNIGGIEFTFSVKEAQSEKKEYQSAVIMENNNVNQVSPIGYTEKIYATFIPSDNIEGGAFERFSKIVEQKREKPILDALRQFDSSIEDIQSTKNGFLFSVKGIKDRVPGNVLGGGIRRFLNIVTTVSEKQNVFVCIDEIENGLHYSAHKLLWKSLLSFSEQNNVQLFITTHNIETLESLTSVLEEDTLGNMREYVKIFKVAKTLKAGYQTYRYSFEGFKEAIEHETEIRN
jgi:AAA15 family ATPase/GTPase